MLDETIDLPAGGNNGGRNDQADEDLIRKYSDGDGWFIVKKSNGLDPLENSFTLERKIGAGGQSDALVARKESEGKEIFYKVILTHLVAHELARKDAIETELSSQGLSLDSFKRVEIDDSLEARLYGPSDGDDSLVSFEFGYDVNSIRRAGKNNYVQRAKEAIANDNQEVLAYLKKRGLFKGKEFTSKNIGWFVESSLRKRKIDLNDFVVKISKKSNDPRGKRERSFAGLSSDVFVAILAYGETVGKRSFYVSEYFKNAIPSGEMYEKLDIHQVLKMGVEMGRALELLEKLNAVGRDIKPDNIMTDGERFKLLDLGLVDYHVEEKKKGGRPVFTFVTEPGVSCGTPFYMAPEQAIPARVIKDENGKVIHYEYEIDARADIYGLAGSMYKVLTDDCPNVSSEDTPDVHNVISNLREGRKPAIPDFEKLKQFYLNNQGWKGKKWVRRCLTSKYDAAATRWAENFMGVLAKGMHRNKEQRYQNPTEFREDLTDLMNFKEPQHFSQDNYSRVLEGAYQNSSPRESFLGRKIVHGLEATAAVLTGAASLMPDAVAKLIPDQADKYLQMVNDLVQSFF